MKRWCSMVKPERGAQRATGNSLFLSEMADVAMNGVTRESCCESPEARVRGSSASAAMCDHTVGLLKTSTCRHDGSVSPTRGWSRLRQKGFRPWAISNLQHYLGTTHTQSDRFCTLCVHTRLYEVMNCRTCMTKGHPRVIPDTPPSTTESCQE